jgi:hypothetical protein
MTQVAALALVDIASCKLQRGIRTHSVPRLPVPLFLTLGTHGHDRLTPRGLLVPDDFGEAIRLLGALQIEERHDLDQSADGQHDREHDQQTPDVALHALLNPLRRLVVLSHLALSSG